MSSLFLSIVNISISASWIILAVVVLRLILKKAPGWFRMSCWGLVGLRLLLPFSIESKLSLIPSADTIDSGIMLSTSPRIYSGVSSIDSVVNPLIRQVFTPDPGSSMNPLQFWIPVFAVVWLLGMAVLLVYMCLSFHRLRHRMGDAIPAEGNIYCSEKVVSPFVLGIFRPKIYLPAQMWENEKEYVLAHEKAHLRRLDHWWKPLGFILLAVYWFNPLVWLSYVLFCRDLEFACDEAVIKALDASERADYSQALLNCCTQRSRISACPLAFGEVGVKDRIKSVLSYKKPAFWIIGTAVIAVVVVCVCLLTTPAKVVPTSPIGEDICNPDYVYAYRTFTDYTNNVVAKDTVISMIFDRKYTLVEEVPAPDLSTAKTREEEIQMYQDYFYYFPDGITPDDVPDYKSAVRVMFSYGPTEELWTFYMSYIKRDVRKSGESVVTYWYRQDLPFYLQINDWYENTVIPSTEDLLNRAQ